LAIEVADNYAVGVISWDLERIGERRRGVKMRG
jgi:hypothetical protein